ncbi:hypothetical protein THAOC_24782, partial [Thalassiosira oceanica]
MVEFRRHLQPRALPDVPRRGDADDRARDRARHRPALHRHASGAAGQRAADPRRWPAEPSGQARYADNGRPDDPDQPVAGRSDLDGSAQSFIWAVLAVTLGFGLIGFLD